ncbi:MAG: hypothetical protein Q9191_008270, partial [Dirinaria sp. TL-2023a]
MELVAEEDLLGIDKIGEDFLDGDSTRQKKTVWVDQLYKTDRVKTASLEDLCSFSHPGDSNSVGVEPSYQEHSFGGLGSLDDSSITLAFPTQTTMRQDCLRYQDHSSAFVGEEASAYTTHETDDSKYVLDMIQSRPYKRGKQTYGSPSNANNIYRASHWPRNPHRHNDDTIHESNAPEATQSLNGFVTPGFPVLGCTDIGASGHANPRSSILPESLGIPSPLSHAPLSHPNGSTSTPGRISPG